MSTRMGIERLNAGSCRPAFAVPSRVGSRIRVRALFFLELCKYQGKSNTLLYGGGYLLTQCRDASLWLTLRFVRTMHRVGVCHIGLFMRF